MFDGYAELAPNDDRAGFLAHFQQHSHTLSFKKASILSPLQGKWLLRENGGVHYLFDVAGVSFNV